MKLGPSQYDTLAAIGSPHLTMIVSDGDRVAKSLQKRGLIEINSGGASINSAGLRALADGVDSGKVKLAPERFRDLKEAHA